MLVRPEQEEITDVERYEHIGASLSDTPEVIDILSTIEKTRQWPSPHPFVVISGSSGVGKTQTAFSLSPKVKVVYLLMVMIQEGDQEVYLSFKQLAYHLHVAIAHDLVEFRPRIVFRQTHSNSTHFLFDQLVCCSLFAATSASRLNSCPQVLLLVAVFLSRTSQSQSETSSNR